MTEPENIEKLLSEIITKYQNLEGKISGKKENEMISPGFINADSDGARRSSFMKMGWSSE